MPLNIIDRVADGIAAVSRYALKDFSAYCDLRTVVRLTDDDRKRRPEMEAPYIFVTHSGDYASVYEIQGAYKPFNEAPQYTEKDRRDTASLQHYLAYLHTAFTPVFRETGHKLSFVFERDPQKAREELVKLLTPLYHSSTRIGLDLTDILNEKIEKLLPLVSRERSFMVVYSARSALKGIQAEEQQIATGLSKAPASLFGQNPYAVELASLKIRHDSVIEKLEKDLARSGSEGILLRLLDAHELGFQLKEEVERNSTAENYQPCLPDDLHWAHGHPQTDDTSSLLAPHLHFQLFNARPKEVDNLIPCDGLYHGNLAMTLGPQKPETFSQLFNKIPRDIPWRVRLDLMPGGNAALATRRWLLSVMALVPGLRSVYDSVARLNATNDHDPVCVMTLSASTWGRDVPQTQRHLSILQKSLQSWGVSDVTQTFGDPYRAWTSTMVASNSGSGPYPMYPPLSEALRFLPLNRPATPWADDVSVVFITPDGKPWPVKLASSKQLKLTDVVAGESGSGKSVLVNVLNEAAVCGGQLNLPFLSIIDKGFTAQGLIRLLQNCLPKERLDEVVGIVLENSAHHCRNPFDVQLGMKYPLTPEREFMINLMESFCIDPELGGAPNAQDCRDILSRVIDAAFKSNAEVLPVRYARTLRPDVDAALETSGLYNAQDPDWWDTASWYEIRDMLFARGFIQEATQAHYQAMPELSDLQVYLKGEDIKSTFGTLNRKGSTETLLDYISRRLSMATSDYRMMAGRTRFALSPNTRVVAIDLNNVIGGETPAAHVRTGIMYLFAGHLAAGHFDLPFFQNEFFRSLPEIYHPLHRERVRQLDQEVKTKVYDELHNARFAPQIIARLETQDRENRKFAIRTVLCSQYLTDFPPAILKSANSLYLMQITPDDLPLLTEHFAVPAHIASQFSHLGKGAAADGSGTCFLAVFRLKSGHVVQILKNPVGPRELWALNSTRADATLRDRLYERLDDKVAREILATRFPAGTAEKLIELRRKQAGEHDHTNVIERLADELIDRYAHLI